MLTTVILLALWIAGLLFIAHKWGFLAWYSVYRPFAWLPPADCLFCLSFWLGCLAVLGMLCFGLSPMSLFYPLPAAVLSAVILTIILPHQ